LALLRGRRFLVPQDVYDVAPEVLRHRLLLTYDGLAAGLQVDDVVARVLATIQAPRVAPHQDESGPGSVGRPGPTVPMAVPTGGSSGHLAGSSASPMEPASYLEPAPYLEATSHDATSRRATS
jgi:MoxR-like ATPase